ncbi:MAG: substrate-binding domain-containing protein [Lachnospiraceae bacterium]|nr:substrate-binding domain-containing protein [Lachnospiraceae bacterium]
MEMKFKKNKWPRYLCALLLVVFVLGISFAKDGKEEKEIIFISKTIDESVGFWDSMVNGANMAAKEYGVNLAVMGPEAETEYEEQGKLIREAIALKPDAIVLAPSSYTETVQYAKEIEDANIELVLVDSLMAETMGRCVVATDNVEAGRKMGDYIQENFSENVSIGVVGHVKGSSTAVEREAGLREGLGELEKQIAEVVFCDSDYTKAYQVTKEMLQKNPDINVIAGLNEYSSIGAAQAVVELDLENKIFMVGFDSSLKEVEYLEAEVFDAIVVQKPLNMGYLAVENTVKLLQNKEIPQDIDSGSALITKDTMYSPENQKLLFPF